MKWVKICLLFGVWTKALIRSKRKEKKNIQYSFLFECNLSLGTCVNLPVNSDENYDDVDDDDDGWECSRKEHIQ